MVHPADPQRPRPHQRRQAPQSPQRRELRRDVQRVGLLDPPVERLRVEVGRVAPRPDALHRRAVVEQPPGVRPPEPLVGRVRVQRRVAVQVVEPVRRGPLDRVALHGQDPAVGEQVLEPLWRLERPVAELPVEAERDAQAARDEVGGEEPGDGRRGVGGRGEQAEGVHGEHEEAVNHVGLLPRAAEERVGLGDGEHVGERDAGCSGLAGLEGAVGLGDGLERFFLFCFVFLLGVFFFRGGVEVEKGEEEKSRRRRGEVQQRDGGGDERCRRQRSQRATTRHSASRTCPPCALFPTLPCHPSCRGARSAATTRFGVAHMGDNSRLVALLSFPLSTLFSPPLPFSRRGANRQRGGRTARCRTARRCSSPAPPTSSWKRWRSRCRRRGRCVVSVCVCVCGLGEGERGRDR